MQRVPWWGLLLIVAVAVFAIVLAVRTMVQKYQARWPW